VTPDAALVVRQAKEVDQITEGHAFRFPTHEPGTIEELVRAEFGRHADAPVQDFVAVFVERALKARLRSHI
jgi:hypothetical protein